MGEQVALGATCSRNCGLMRAGQTAFFLSSRSVPGAPLAASVLVLQQSGVKLLPSGSREKPGGASNAVRPQLFLPMAALRGATPEQSGCMTQLWAATACVQTPTRLCRWEYVNSPDPYRYHRCPHELPSVLLTNAQRLREATPPGRG